MHHLLLEAAKAAATSSLSTGKHVKWVMAGMELGVNLPRVGKPLQAVSRMSQRESNERPNVAVLFLA